MADAPSSTGSVMEQIVSLTKRRGFVYPASEIYGGLNGFWDYGPLGVLLKNNIRDHWWRNMVLAPPIGPNGHPIDMVGVDTSIIQNPKTWVASGHADTFTDPMVDDTETKQRFRADHLMGLFVYHAGLADAEAGFEADLRAGDIPSGAALEATAIGSGAFEAAADWGKQRKVGRYKIEEESVIKAGVSFGGNFYQDIKLRLTDRKSGETFFGIVYPVTREMYAKHLDKIPSPYTGKRGTLTEPRAFNLMFQTYVGAIQSDDARAYLRPETAQGIFLQYKNIVDTTRVKIPFGVAQVGKSFRNEVTPRNFIFRSREFEQMEMEWFCAPDESAKWYEFWKAERMKWWRDIGVSESNLRMRDHEPDELSHYSKMTVDIEYRYPFTAPDFGELEGIAHRGDYDLTQHAKHSGQKIDYFDQENSRRFVPNVIEPASGLTRAVLVLLCEAFTVDETRPSKYVMKFAPQMAPIKVGVYPLVNKEGMPEIAEKLYMDLRQRYTVDYDPKQAIGKRYARMDEIGTPYCFTVDGQTLQDQTLTVRHRDTAAQERIALDKVKPFLAERLG